MIHTKTLFFLFQIESHMHRLRKLTSGYAMPWSPISVRLVADGGKLVKIISIETVPTERRWLSFGILATFYDR